MTSLFFRGLTALAAPSGIKGRLSVFYFHRVPERPDPLLPSEPDARMFDRILGWIGAQFRVLDPLDACDRLFEGTLPARSAVITFDDGYRDNYTVALPILKSHGMRATFFVSTGFLDGKMMFNDRVIEAVRRSTRPALPLPGSDELLSLESIERRRDAIDRVLRAVKHLPPDERCEQVAAFERHAGGERIAHPLMMSAEEVAALHRAGMRIGGHTRSHPILVKLDDDEARIEIQGGIDDLAGIIGAQVDLFAYPNGRPEADFAVRHIEMVKSAGCRYAFTTIPGSALRSSDPHALPRFTPWDRDRLRFSARALHNLRRPAH